MSEIKKPLPTTSATPLKTAGLVGGLLVCVVALTAIIVKVNKI